MATRLHSSSSLLEGLIGFCCREDCSHLSKSDECDAAYPALLDKSDGALLSAEIGDGKSMCSVETQTEPVLITALDETAAGGMSAPSVYFSSLAHLGTGVAHEDMDLPPTQTLRQFSNRDLSGSFSGKLLLPRTNSIHSGPDELDFLSPSHRAPSMEDFPSSSLVQSCKMLVESSGGSPIRSPSRASFGLDNSIDAAEPDRSTPGLSSSVDDNKVSHSFLPGRAQVHLEGEWRDVAEEEFKQICDHIAAGESSFAISARGQSYLVDLSGTEGATQTNTKTGKMRKLRILDVADEREPMHEQGLLPTVPEEPSTMLEAEFSQQEESDTQTAKASSGTKPIPRMPKTKAKAKAKTKKKAKAQAKAKETQSSEVLEQLKLGPQSKRGDAPQFQLNVLEIFPHAQSCWKQLAENEEKLCGEFAVFYHSYSFAALIYEVQAAVAAVLFRFRSQYASLPRLLVHEFSAASNAAALLNKFDNEFASGLKDHDPGYRALAISVMCSLCALGPEASPPVVFIAGYSQVDMSFRGVLENLLQSCFVPKKQVNRLANDILALSERHGLDVSQFGGAKCPSGKSGHMLQIFIRRSLIDELVYAAQPWGHLDHERHPISRWLDGDNNTSWGQARILAHPKYFMSAASVRMYVASADPTFNENRGEFQEELTKLLGAFLEDPSLRERAALGIYGGTLPAWWTTEDQRHHAQAAHSTGPRSSSATAANMVEESNRAM